MKYSKELSYVLRHGAASEGIAIDTAGYIGVDLLLSRPQFHGLGLANIQTIVSSCPKQRFGLEQRDCGWYIRANQGHTLKSVASEDLLTPLTQTDLARFPIVVHGTNFTAWNIIKTAGLNHMARQHIHFATGLPGDNGVISGMRNNSHVLIYIDLARALSAAIPFFVSANGVILSPGLDGGSIPPEFFTDVVNTHTGESLLASGRVDVGIVPIAVAPVEDTGSTGGLLDALKRLDSLPQDAKNARKRLRRKIAKLKAE